MPAQTIRLHPSGELNHIRSGFRALVHADQVSLDRRLAAL
jgi:hypothetical protein